MPVCFRVGFRAPQAMGKPHEVVNIYGKMSVDEPEGDYVACNIHEKVALVQS